MSGKSDLPFGSEFSPSQIELAHVIELADNHKGDQASFEAAVRTAYFDKHGTAGDAKAAYNRNKLANNTWLSLRSYGLIDATSHLTEVGEELLALKGDEAALHERLALHILLHLHGMTLIQCLQDMVAAGEVIKLETIAASLHERGIRVPSTGRNLSSVRLWLAKAGAIVGNRWQVDAFRIEEILGVSPNEFEVLAGFTPEQRAFVRALANTGKTSPQPANEIARLAAATYGVKFPEKSLPKLVLNALVAAGYIEAQKTTSGRGAKPYEVWPTKKLIADIVEPMLEQLKGQIDPKLMKLLRTPLADILDEMKSKDRFKAGLALEALAFKVMRLLDMTYVATRLRANQTGGAEVDLVFESTRLVFSRWQVQCKNTSSVSLDDVAKEVGLTRFLKSNAIVIVTTGDIGGEARRYANAIMADENLAIVMLDGNDLDSIGESPARIVRALEREARHAMNLKKLEL